MNAQESVTWPGRAETAASVHDVIESSRDFLAQLTPYEVHALPVACKPPLKLVDADDVNAYAFALVRHECEDDADHAELLQKMADYFAHAALRLAELSKQQDGLGPPRA